MIDQITNNFYFMKLEYIVMVVIIGFAVMNNLNNKSKIKIKEYIKGIDIYILFKYMFLSFIIVTTVQLVFISNNKQEILNSFNILEILAQFITNCIFAPIFEEIIFRFGIYKKLNKKINIFISIIITSILFSLLHLYEIEGFIILLGISIVWNYVFYKSNNLVYPILLHFIHNLYALAIDFFNYNNYLYILLLLNIIGFIILTKKQKN